ncbi:MAG: thioesterase family protein [Bacteroidales bacterium]|jgi:acyl-CoA thioester hydrolase|nr:thioesterase family protein [Bacteroidales bacterium]
MTNSWQYFHQIPIQIRFNDFDLLQHVNNSVYQNYFDLARSDYFEKVFGKKIQWDTRGLVLARVSIDFIRPILDHEEIEVFTKIYQLGNKSLRMTQKIIQTETRELKATCESVMVAYNNSADKPCPIPHDWRQRITHFEKDLDFNE